MILLVLSICSILLGYYLMAIPPYTPLEHVIRDAEAGIFLTAMGGLSIIIHIYRRAK